MPKRLALLVSAFALLAFSASAGETCKSRGDLSWLLAPVAPLAPTAEVALVPEAQPLDLASVERTGNGSATRCSVTASCDGYSINCSVSGTGCSGHDRACPSFQGHVTCNGVTTWCEPACPVCNDGQIMWQPTGGCCNDLTEKDKYKCVGGQWEYQGTFCKIPFCGPF